MKYNKIIALVSIFLIQVGCRTRKAIEINCDSYINTEDSNSSLDNYQKWEDCLIEETIKTKTKKQLYNDIKGNRIQKSLLVGISGEISQRYLSSKALSKILTEREITANLESEDLGIKYNSFYAIAKRKKTDVFESLIPLLKDTTKVYEQYGCLVNEVSFADLCINLVLGIEHDGETYQLNVDEVSVLDSLIIANNPELRYGEWLK